MNEMFKYVNHLNESIQIGQDGILANYNDLRDYSWDVVLKNNKISRFSKGVVEKTIPLIIYCSTVNSALQMKNKLFEIAEKDVIANKAGRIYIDGYYLKCFIVGSKKSNYLYHKRYLELQLRVVTDYPYWIKETEIKFNSIDMSGSDLEYPYDYPFDFAPDISVDSIINSSFYPSDFRMIIYGYTVDPQIHIGGHLYEVNVAIETGEYVTIDSIEKKIFLTKVNGETVNCFNDRNKESYIFEKIKPGNQPVTFSHDLIADIILIESRGEPKWI